MILRQWCSFMGQAGRGWQALCGSALLTGQAVESTLTGSASWVACLVQGGGTANTVCWSNWRSLVRNSAMRAKKQKTHYFCSQILTLQQTWHTNIYNHSIPFTQSGENPPCKFRTKEYFTGLRSKRWVPWQRVPKEQYTMTQNLMEFKGIVHTCFKDKINAGEFENKEQLPQAFLFFLCFSLRLLTCREPCQYKRNKGYTGETEE